MTTTKAAAAAAAAVARRKRQRKAAMQRRRRHRRDSQPERRAFRAKQRSYSTITTRRKANVRARRVAGRLKYARDRPIADAEVSSARAAAHSAAAQSSIFETRQLASPANCRRLARAMSDA